jgi:hypothetical protein
MINNNRLLVRKLNVERIKFLKGDLLALLVLDLESVVDCVVGVVTLLAIVVYDLDRKGTKNK